MNKKEMQKIADEAIDLDKVHYKERFSYMAVEAQIKFLQGKVLTIIDASIEGERQNNSIKQLINNAFSEQLSWCLDLASDFQVGRLEAGTVLKPTFNTPGLEVNEQGEVQEIK